MSRREIILAKFRFGKSGRKHGGIRSVFVRGQRHAQNGRFAFLDHDVATERVSILNTGNVGIGTTAPTERLHVVGNIRVTGSITYGAPEEPLPYYVFEPDYILMPIDDLEKFIAREKHLPNIPAAGEIKDKGLNLGKFQMKLLKKNRGTDALHRAAGENDPGTAPGR
jgi:hypothetical protein